MVNQQPGTKEMMSLTPGGNRNAKNMPMTPDGQRDWSNGICDCCGDGAFGTWCLSCWCPCIVYGENSSRIEHLAQNGVPHPKGGDACGGDCWLHCCLTSFLGVGWILQIPGRSRIRSRYSIDGGCFTDCCTVFWCNPCSLTQEHREIQLEERSILQANGMAGV
ncbi:PLAC8-domain-containing protein [Dendrothele bispora CBS 962.96]|uniref:PLAC8-domain-containing protein n=1 Tax=Dendrothele bispora (strain CBS 962.96) TaxID=1314807 RepID=A0A4S8KUK3_DENBC|nr:PLAC8-domain-containing protein [Dendrothele bispora CBS 962.96]THU94369.1 PLAC8-domain-containing protein [Dendrothele bispora CBS 962.96]